MPCLVSDHILLKKMEIIIINTTMEVVSCWAIICLNVRTGPSSKYVKGILRYSA